MTRYPAASSSGCDRVDRGNQRRQTVADQPACGAISALRLLLCRGLTARLLAADRDAGLSRAARVL
jgi:hypothetical protein